MAFHLYFTKNQIKKIMVNKFLILILFSNLLTAQSVKPIDLNEVITWALSNHPIAKQVDFHIRLAKADLQISKSVFDPMLQLGDKDKNFKGVGYYSESDLSLSIPTWQAIDFQFGLQSLSGQRPDPTNTLGLTNFIGAKLPLGKFLITDKRRTVIKQNRIGVSLSESQKKIILNDFTKEVIETYLDWLKYYQQKILIEQIISNANLRFDFVKKSFQLGERSAIDTTEALVQIQKISIRKLEVDQDFINTGLYLSSLLGPKTNGLSNINSKYIPNIEINQNTSFDLQILNIDELLENLNNTHPEILNYNYKLKSLQLEKKLRFQEFIPKLDLNYNFLNNRYDLFKTEPTTSTFRANYDYKAQLEIPLGLTFARGSYKKVKLHILEAENYRDLKSIDLEYKLRKSYNDYEYLKSQFTLTRLNLENYITLLRAEEEKFKNGESSLFLINSRESSYLEAQEKLIKSRIQYIYSFYMIQWVNCTLNSI